MSGGGRGRLAAGAQTRGAGPAADCLCPAITFHADRSRAEDHLRRQTELSGLVLDQDRAVGIAGWSFGALLAPEPVAVSTEGRS